MNYPSSIITAKNIGLILAAIIIVGGAVVISRNHKNAATNDYVYQSAISATSTLIDIKGEVPTDWEKTLISTHTYDPKNPTIDFKNGTTTKTKELTSTQILARTLFSKYMSLNQLGLGNDAQSQTDSVNEVLAASLKNFNPTVYEEKDIKESADGSVEAYRAYGNAVGLTVMTNSIQARNETVIVRESLDKNDPKILDEIDPTIASYKKILKGLLAIKAPKGMKTAHLDVVNSVSVILYLDQNFKKTFSDPVLSLQAIAYYEQAVQDFTASFLSVRTTLIAKGIKYQQNEGGTLFITP